MFHISESANQSLMHTTHSPCSFCCEMAVLRRRSGSSGHLVAEDCCAKRTSLLEAHWLTPSSVHLLAARGCHFATLSCIIVKFGNNQTCSQNRREPSDRDRRWLAERRANAGCARLTCNWSDRPCPCPHQLHTRSHVDDRNVRVAVWSSTRRDAVTDESGYYSY